MSDRFALQAWDNAESHLAEARMLHPETTPGGLVHIAYYAMFHAARAVLLRVEGTAPKKHANVIGQFSLLVRDRSEAFKQAAHDLNKAEDYRLIADYHDTKRITVENAREALDKAINFLDLCAKEFGFPRGQGAPK